jgi:hypothetical protein
MFDPVVSFLHGVDSHKDQQVRRALSPLAAHVAEQNCRALGSVHLNKGAMPKFIHRVTESVGSQIRRAPWWDSRRARTTGFISVTQNTCCQSMGRRAGSTSSALGIDRCVKGVTLAIFDGRSDKQAGDLVGPQLTSDQRPERDEAREYLRNALQTDPGPAKLREEVMKATG